jgi:NAD(P)-dependent dehydrogenase (short-subunit alcohol dehydrogenase family)
MAESHKEKVALITGGSRGIGYGIARRLRAEGASVVLVARKAEQLAAAAKELRDEVAGQGEVLHFAGNAGNPDDAQAVVADTVQRLGAVHILVNNAATNPYFGDLKDIDLPRALKTTQVNQFGVVAWTKAVYETSMRESKGAIVNIASVGGYIVDPGIGWYNSTKAAIILMTRQLAQELGPHVRVNAVAPGVISTELAAEVVAVRKEILEKALPMRRLGRVEDVAAAVSFLASDSASWITGQTLLVDGGALTLPVGV